MNFWWWRAYAGYRLARWLLRFAWLVRQPRAWQWMQGQYARMAALGYVPAQSFYGHLLLHRGQGFAVGDEARRLLRLAAQGGDDKAAYQLGVLALQGSVQEAPDARQAASYWQMASDAGHPLATYRLAQLYRQGGPGLACDLQADERLEQRAHEQGY